MKIRNLTPHALHVIVGDTHMDIPADGEVVRVTTTEVSLDPVIVDGVAIPVLATEYGGVDGLPPPEEGVILIVSGMVLSALGGSRSDVYAPGPLVRDDGGHPIGCMGLRR